MRPPNNNSNNRPPPRTSEGKAKGTGTLRPYEDFPHAVLLRDLRDRVTYLNSAASALFALDQSNILGKTLPSLLGSGSRTRPRRSGVERLEFRRRDGRTFFLEHWAHSLTMADADVQLTVDFLLDVTERTIAERTLKEQTAFIALLQEVAIAANESASVEEALRRSLDCICGLTGWPVGHVYLLPHRGADELVPTSIWHIALPRQFDKFRRITEATRMRRGVGMPGSVFASGKPLWVMDVRHHPNFPRAHAAHDIGVRAGFAFPILVAREPVGVLEFFSPDAIEPNPHLLESMAQVGTQLGRVVERAWAEDERSQLLARERAALAEAEAAQKRVAFLYDATTKLIAESPNSLTTLETISRVALPDFADWCVVDLFGDAHEAKLAESHRDESKAKLVSRFYARLRQATHSPVGQALLTGKPMHLADLGKASWARHKEMRRLLAQNVATAILIVPLIARTRGLGIVCFGIVERLFSPEDEVLADDLGHRIALAVDNLRLFSQAQQAVKAREDVLAAISHDLRTPASSIVTTTEVLEADILEIDTRTRERLRRVRRSGLRMIRMITSLLDQARIEAGHLRLNIDAEPASWPGLLAEAIEQVEPLAAARHIRIKRSRAVSCALTCDRDRVLQVLTNVLSNATKFTRSEGQIDIVTTLRKGQLTLSVTDRCGGIDPREVPLVFERFFRGHKDSSTAGTGLGLFIAKGIVEAHGGRIYTENADEVDGCRFVITLPLAGPSPAVVPRKSSS